MTRFTLASMLASSVLLGMPAALDGDTAPRWQERVIVVHDWTPALMDGMVKRATQAWNKARSGPRFRYRREAMREDCDGVRPPRRGHVAICARIVPGLYGTTRTRKEGGDIERSRARVVVDPADPATSYAVLLHELGHVLGLPHIAEPASVMYPWAMGTMAQAPTAADTAVLRERYRKDRDRLAKRQKR